MRKWKFWGTKNTEDTPQCLMSFLTQIIKFMVSNSFFLLIIYYLRIKLAPSGEVFLNPMYPSTCRYCPLSSAGVFPFILSRTRARGRFTEWEHLVRSGCTWCAATYLLLVGFEPKPRMASMVISTTTWSTQPPARALDRVKGQSSPLQDYICIWFSFHIDH